MNELVLREKNEIKEAQSFSPELFNKWIHFIDAKPKTIDTYTKNVKYFFKYLSENAIKNPTRENVISYRDYLKSKYKATTTQGYIMALKQFFNWTESEGIYPNISNHIKGAKLDRDFKKDYLSSKQVANLLSDIDTSTLKGARDYAILSLMVTSGLRTIEVSRADIRDMRTLGDFTVLYIQGKGKDDKSDYIKIVEPVEKAIRKYLSIRGKAQGEEPLFSSIANRNSNQRMTTRSVSRLVKDHLLASGFNSDRLTAHSLRHTTATLNLLNGGSVEETQQLLRHSNINTTLIYSHALERAKNNSEDRVAKSIFSQLS